MQAVDQNITSKIDELRTNLLNAIGNGDLEGGRAILNSLQEITEEVEHPLDLTGDFIADVFLQTNSKESLFTLIDERSYATFASGLIKLVEREKIKEEQSSQLKFWVEHLIRLESGYRKFALLLMGIEAHYSSAIPMQEMFTFFDQGIGSFKTSSYQAFALACTDLIRVLPHTSIEIYGSSVYANMLAWIMAHRLECLKAMLEPIVKIKEPKEANRVLSEVMLALCQEHRAVLKDLLEQLPKVNLDHIRVLVVDLIAEWMEESESSFPYEKGRALTGLRTLLSEITGSKIDSYAAIAWILGLTHSLYPEKLKSIFLEIYGLNDGTQRLIMALMSAGQRSPWAIPSFLAKTDLIFPDSLLFDTFLSVVKKYPESSFVLGAYRWLANIIVADIEHKNENTQGLLLEIVGPENDYRRLALTFISIYREEASLVKQLQEAIFKLSASNIKLFFDAFAYALEGWSVNNKDFSVIANSLTFLSEQNRMDIVQSFVKMVARPISPYVSLAHLLSAINLLPNKQKTAVAKLIFEEKEHIQKNLSLAIIELYQNDCAAAFPILNLLVERLGTTYCEELIESFAPILVEWLVSVRDANLPINALTFLMEEGRPNVIQTFFKKMQESVPNMKSVFYIVPLAEILLWVTEKLPAQLQIALEPFIENRCSTVLAKAFESIKQDPQLLQIFLNHFMEISDRSTNYTMLIEMLVHASSKTSLNSAAFSFMEFVNSSNPKFSQELFSRAFECGNNELFTAALAVIGKTWDGEYTESFIEKFIQSNKNTLIGSESILTMVRLVDDRELIFDKSCHLKLQLLLLTITSGRCDVLVDVLRSLYSTPASLIGHAGDWLFYHSGEWRQLIKALAASDNNPNMIRKALALISSQIDSPNGIWPYGDNTRLRWTEFFDWLIKNGPCTFVADTLKIFSPHLFKAFGGRDRFFFFAMIYPILLSIIQMLLV